MTQLLPQRLLPGECIVFSLGDKPEVLVMGLDVMIDWAKDQLPEIDLGYRGYHWGEHLEMYDTMHDCQTALWSDIARHLKGTVHIAFNWIDAYKYLERLDDPKPFLKQLNELAWQAPF